MVLTRSMIGNINTQLTECVNLNLLKNIWDIIKIYLFWIVIHFVCSNLYCYLCTNLSITGFLISPFIVMSPHCKALMWLTSTSITNINNMWLVLGTWFITKMKKE